MHAWDTQYKGRAWGKQFNFPSFPHSYASNPILLRPPLLFISYVPLQTPFMPMQVNMHATGSVTFGSEHSIYLSCTWLFSFSIWRAFHLSTNSSMAAWHSTLWTYYAYPSNLDIWRYLRLAVWRLFWHCACQHFLLTGNPGSSKSGFVGAGRRQAHPASGWEEQRETCRHPWVEGSLGHRKRRRK